MPRGGDYSVGQRQAHAVNLYLEAIAAGEYRGQRGPTMRLRLERVDSKLASDGLSMTQRVELVQKRLDYQRALDGDSARDLDALEAAFIEHCKPFSDRKGISYAAWRAVGVPARVLRLAGWTEAGPGTGGLRPRAAEPAEASAEPPKPRRARGSTSAA